MTGISAKYAGGVHLGIMNEMEYFSRERRNKKRQYRISLTFSWGNKTSQHHLLQLQKPFEQFFE